MFFCRLITRTTKPQLHFTKTITHVNKLSPFITSQHRFYAKKKSSAEEKKKANTVGVVVTGNGFLDGSDCLEALAVHVALQQRGFNVMTFAPEGEIDEVFNHITKKIIKHEVRDIHQEVVRMTRVPLQKWNQLRPENLAAVIFVGGGGCYRILSNFYKREENDGDYTVDPTVEEVIKGFHTAEKPIGFTSSAPVLAAKVLGTVNGGPGIEIAYGENEEEAKVLESFGNKIVEKDSSSVLVDKKNKIVMTTGHLAPSASYASIFEGVTKLVDNLLGLLGRQTAEQDKKRAMAIAEALACFLGESEQDAPSSKTIARPRTPEQEEAERAAAEKNE